MRRGVNGARLVTAIAICCLLAGLPLMAQQPAEKLETLETVVVVGGYATPQMWKVSKGGHVLWLLVIGEPAPVGVKWRTAQLEARVAESQLVLYGSTGPGFRSSASRKTEAADRQALEKAKVLPGKGTLKDALPPETYARWRVLKTTYIGSDEAIERRCPSCAMEELERRVKKKVPPPPTGLALQPLVENAAKKYKVKSYTMPGAMRPMEFTEAEYAMARMSGVLDLGDVKCFTQRLDYLERLIKYSEQQADVTARNNATPPRSERCFGDYPARTDWNARWIASGKLTDPAAAQSMSDRITSQMNLAWQQLDADWMVAAQAALAKNKSTFAVLSVEPWGHPKSYIAQFRELGYEVEEPGSVE